MNSKKDYFTVKDLSIKFNDFKLEKISFSIDKGDYLAIIGPTGSGKTLILETIAGIHSPDEGEIYLKGEKITYLPPEKRKIGIIYQDYGLFPHLTVIENILYGVKKEKEKKVEHISELLKLKNLLNRYPSTLSGGEKQRVALARALIVEPELLLMDEPFSALDIRTRMETRKFVKKLVSELRFTTIHITHDLDDVWLLSNKVMIIKNGKVLQFGELKEIMHKPKDKFVADFVGTNILKGTVVSKNKDGITISVEGKLIKSTDTTPENGEEIAIGIRPENILIFNKKPNMTSARNIIDGKITDYFFEGRIAYIFVSIGSQELKVALTLNAFEELHLFKGKKVFLTIKATSLKVI